MHIIRMVLSICILIFISSITIGCNTSTKTIEGYLEKINEEEVQVNCSDEATKGQRNGNSIGYYCIVKVTEETRISAIDDSQLTLEQLEAGSELLITLTRTENIRKKIEKKQTLDLTAQSIKVITPPVESSE